MLVQKIYNLITGKLQPMYKPIQNYNDAEKLIISLTSIPKRKRSLRKTLKSLIKQDYENFEIQLNLPKEMEGRLKVRHPKIKLYYVDDIGPLTKLYYTLQRYQGTEQKIITVDDDIVYHPQMLSAYASMSISKRAVGFAGINITNGVLKGIHQVNRPTRVDILEGYKTVCYCASYFEDDFFEKFARQPVFDDALISGYLKHKGIDRVVMPHKFPKTEHWFNHFPTNKLLNNPPSGCEELKEQYGDYQTNYIEFFNSLKI